MKNLILEVRNISKSFLQPDKTRLEVLKELSIEVERGTIIAITGVSGSGKSTLLHLLGSLDEPDEGDILMDGRSILSFKPRERTFYRNQQVGFIFQFHYLLPELNVLENIALPYLLKNFEKELAFERATKLLDDVGLGSKKDYMTYQLSGGERQRAAIARGLVNSPNILLADEPTGNLDWKTGEKVFSIFQELLKEYKLTAIIVTHNEQLAALLDKRYHLQAGKLV